MTSWWSLHIFIELSGTEDSQAQTYLCARTPTPLKSSARLWMADFNCDFIFSFFLFNRCV